MVLVCVNHIVVQLVHNFYRIVPSLYVMNSGNKLWTINYWLHSMLLFIHPMFHYNVIVMQFHHFVFMYFHYVMIHFHIHILER
ncbi:hypothetical protein BLA29_014569 [Euroglyphus maynei]|uniref:Uncharacterized protein n=1 Tax=Euroglyphus maynei TaxID=6958 RepID=A0A1Y3BIX3_EURMA|nr:hypothetical protein BLA29_014569 [Euroglyphus maynei]